MKKNVIIGGAWPYANSSLHLGHIAGLISGDVLARFFRLKGDNVLYVSGSDTHGTPWICRKEDISKFNNVIYTCSVVIANLANLFEPIMPESCGKIREYLKIKEKKWEYILIDENLKLSSIEPLFKRIQ